MAETPRWRRALLLVLKLGIAAALLAWLVRSGKLEPDKIWGAVQANPLWLVLTLAIYNVCILLTSLRWHMLLVSQGLRPTRLECLKMTYIGCFFSCFLPGGTGGDLVKAYYVARDSAKKTEAVTTVFIDRVFGLYCMIGLAAVAILFRARHLWHYGGAGSARDLPLGLTLAQLLVVGVVAGFVAATVGFLVFLSPRCRRLVHYLLDHLPQAPASVLKRIYEAVYLYRGQRGVLAWFVLYSVSAHALAAVSLWLVGLSLSEPIALGGTRALNYLFLIPLGLVLNGLPIAPAGVGVFEWALDFLFGTVVAAGERNLGATVAALGHILIILTNHVGLIFYLKGKRRVAEALQAARHQDAPATSAEPAPDDRA